MADGHGQQPTMADTGLLDDACGDGSQQAPNLLCFVVIPASLQHPKESSIHCKHCLRDVSKKTVQKSLRSALCLSLAWPWRMMIGEWCKGTLILVCCYNVTCEWCWMCLVSRHLSASSFDCSYSYTNCISVGLIWQMQNWNYLDREDLYVRPWVCLFLSCFVG